MFDIRCKAEKGGKLSKTLKLHAATKRKLEFVNEFAGTLRAAYPEVAGHCEDLGHSIAAILQAAGELDDAPDEPTDLVSEAEVDEATEAKLDEIAPRKNAG